MPCNATAGSISYSYKGTFSDKYAPKRVNCSSDGKPGKMGRWGSIGEQYCVIVKYSLDCGGWAYHMPGTSSTPEIGAEELDPTVMALSTWAVKRVNPYTNEGKCRYFRATLKEKMKIKGRNRWAGGCDCLDYRQSMLTTASSFIQPPVIA